MFYNYACVYINYLGESPIEAQVPVVWTAIVDSINKMLGKCRFVSTDINMIYSEGSRFFCFGEI